MAGPEYPGEGAVFIAGSPLESSFEANKKKIKKSQKICGRNTTKKKKNLMGAVNQE